MHRLAASFVLGYHGCDRQVGERLLANEPFKPSDNGYDWLGPGIYFWEANPRRGLEFAHEAAIRRRSYIGEPFVVGAVIDLAHCLDLTTAEGIACVRFAYETLAYSTRIRKLDLPKNSADGLRRKLDCAVIRRIHGLLEGMGQPSVDTVRGVFTEGHLIYPDGGLFDKTHIQIAVRNATCIKGVFRVPADHLQDITLDLP